MQRKPATDCYFMGIVVSLYLSFAVATVIGIALGGWIPDGRHLDPVLPLTFLALLAPPVGNRRSLLIAVIATGLSI